MSKRLAIIVAAVLLTVGVAFFMLREGTPAAEAQPQGPAKLGPTVVVTPSTRSLRGVTPTRAGGVVKDTQGAPVSGALVLLTPLEGELDEDADPITATSSDSGEWTLETVDSGRYAISATADGFLPGHLADIELLAEADNNALDFALSPGGMLFRGKVSDITGGEIEGAYLSVRALHGFESKRAASFAARTNAQGEFRMQVPAGRHRVSVQHLDYSPKSAVLQFTQGERQRDFELTPMGVVEGVVLAEADGKPVPGAMVSVAKELALNFPGGGGDVRMQPLKSVVADDQGRFRIRGLQSGAIELRAVAQSLASEQPFPLALDIAQNIDGIVLRVGEARSVTGVVHVKGDPGRPVAGASIDVGGRDGASLGTKSDAEGRFTLHGLRDGPNTIVSMARGFVPNYPGARIEVGEQTPPITLELDPGLSIRGRVEPPGPADIRVEFDPSSFSLDLAGSEAMNILGSGGGTRANLDGEFEIAPVGAGPVTLTAQRADGRAGSVEVNVGDQGAQGVVIELEPRASYAGTVVDATGQPVADATVSLKKAASKGGFGMTVIVNGQDMGASSSPTAQDGSFEIRGLDEGAYEVSVSAPGLGILAWAQALDPKRPEAGLPVEFGKSEQRTGEQLRVEARNSYIRGVVLTDEGQPARDVWVTPTMDTQVGVSDTPEPEQGRTMVMMVASSDDGSGDPVGSLPPTLTDTEGRFAFERLRDGSYSLVAEAPGGSGRVKHEGIKTNADLRLKLAALAGVSGSVKAAGLKTEGALVSVSGPVSTTGVVHGGRYEIDRLDPGRYQLEVRTAQGSQSANFTVAAGETATVDLELQALLRLKGRVLDTQGEPIANASVIVGGGVAMPGSGAGEDDGDEAPEDQEMRMELSIGDEQDAGNVTDEEGRFDIAVASGMRLLMITAPNSPMPIAIRPVPVGDVDVDIGDIRQGDMPEGAQMGGPPPEAPSPAP